MRKLSNLYYPTLVFALGAIIFVLSLDHYLDGNIVIYPLHAFEFIASGELTFEIMTEDKIQTYYPNFHSFLYVIYISIFYKILSFFGQFDPFSMNLIIKIANLILIMSTGYLFSLFFNAGKVRKAYLLLAYCLIPSSILGFISVVEDQVLTPFFLLLFFYSIDKEKSLLWTILAGSMAILSKESTGSLGLALILFGEVFILQRISLTDSVKIFLSSFSLAILIYSTLCLAFSLDPFFIIYATAGHLAGGGFQARNILLQSRYIFQAFTPFILIFLPLFLSKYTRHDKRLMFSLFLFLSIISVNILTGYANIRYLSAFIPIILVNILRSDPSQLFYNQITTILAILSSITFVYIVGDPFLYISNLNEKSMNQIFYIALIFLGFCIFSIFLSKLNDFKSFHFLAVSSSIIFINMSLKDYQIGYSHGFQQIKPIINMINKDEYIFSDLPSPEFYFRNRVIHITSPTSHFFSKNAWGGDSYDIRIDIDESRKIQDQFRGDFINRKMENLSKFYVWTYNGSQAEAFFRSNADCSKLNKITVGNSINHLLMHCEK